MKTNFIIALSAIFFLQAFSLVKSTSPTDTVHVIMFVEDDPAQSIYASCQKDAKLFKEELEFIRKYADMQVKFYRTTFRKSSVQAIVNSLECSSSDVILFYYNGHGYNYGDSDYPCLNFHESSYTSNHIYLEDLHRQLKGKGARLTLTIGDCCNQIDGKYYAPLTEQRKRALQYLNLFKFSEGEVLVASSRKGQYSYVYDHGSGSYFTMNFLEALHEAVESGNANWGNILENTKQKTKATSGGTQIPYFLNTTKIVRPNNTFEK